MRSVPNHTSATAANSSGHVQSNASCVQGVVPHLTISMHWMQTLFISAGVYMHSFYSSLSEVYSRQEHACPHECQQPGICDIATRPQSVEETFVGRFGRHQYTKVGLSCSLMTWSTNWASSTHSKHSASCVRSRSHLTRLYTTVPIVTHKIRRHCMYVSTITFTFLLTPRQPLL